MSGFAIVVFTIFAIAGSFGSSKPISNTITFLVFTPDNEVSVCKDSISLSEINNSNISYKLNGKINKLSLADLEYDEVSITDDSLIGGIVGYIILFLIMSFLFLILKEMTEIFISLDASIKNKVWFSINNYNSLRRIGYMLMMVCIIPFINSCVYFFLIDDIMLNNESVYIIPKFSCLFSLFYVLIIFIIAHVYKEGILMREEQDLTI